MIEIPNYEILKPAGRGGAAEVYIARHTLLDRTVAVKAIYPAAQDSGVDRRFLKEAKVAAGLRHPNIVSIYDVGTSGGRYYIIMEYLGGGDLKQCIKKGLPVERSLEILVQIASALAHAHEQGFIHRDIKSGNIMFRADGTPVLTDFGVVKDLTADAGLTLHGTSIGTPQYMSPEQARGAEKIDWRTDLYSLGATFYEMLTGRLPYTADSQVALALKHINDPVPQLPPHLARCQFIIDRLMAKKPENRYQSAGELAEAVEKVRSRPFFEFPEEQIDYRERTALKPGKGLRRRMPGKAACLLPVLIIAGLIFLCPARLSKHPDSGGNGIQADRHKAGVEGISASASSGSQAAAGHEALAEFSDAASGDFSDSISEYRDIFSFLDSGDSGTGKKGTAEVRAAVKERIRSGIKRHKELNKEIPEEFMRLVSENLPEFDEIREAQYEILLAEAGGAENAAEKAGLYLRALKLEPARPLARQKIRSIARELFSAGRINEAADVLRKASSELSGNSGFDRLLREIEKTGNLKAELFTDLYRIRSIRKFSEKIEAYDRLFSKLESAVSAHGYKKMSGPAEEIKKQVKKDAEALESEGSLIPEKFIRLASGCFPGLKEYLKDTQYDILLKKGEKAGSSPAKAEIFVQALRLDPARIEALEKIRELCLEIEQGGSYQSEISALEQALTDAPLKGAAAELRDEIFRQVSVYPTESGCSEGRRISEAQVTQESLELCIRYRNMAPDSVVHVFLSGRGSRSLEVPVVLTERSGTRSISLSAPVEGFGTGNYSISVKHGDEVLANAGIKFVPKRR